MELQVQWLGRLPYRDAWAIQRDWWELRDRGDSPDRLMLVEHEPVLTLGRHATEAHVIASPAQLADRHIEVIRVERGGEVTYHGPGQLVAYPIVRLRDRPVLLRPFVRALELAMADVAGGYGVAASPRPGYPGVWVDVDGPAPRKLGALGLRVERGITFHGIALNIRTQLEDFELIDPCGMVGLDVTSIARELHWQGAAEESRTVEVERAGSMFAEAFRRRLEDAEVESMAQRPDRDVAPEGTVTSAAPEGAVPAAAAGIDLATMAGGLFELRRDDITGWWVATVVDREFDRARFARPARRMGTPDERCQNCASAPKDRAWLRVLKPQAFTLAGSEHPARDRDGSKGQDGVAEELGLGLVGDVGAWETIVAPFGHHAPLNEETEAIVIEMLRLARDRIVRARERGETQYLQVVQNWGEQAGAMTNHLCLDVYDLPQIPHRVGEELGGAARYVIREGICPWCRLVQGEVARRERLVFEDAASVCFAPYASRSPFELWIVPRRHASDFSAATDEQLTSAAEALQKVIRLLGTLDGPAYNLVLHTAPLRENVSETFHWHWEVHPRLREIGGLELGTGLPVNPISPEEAVDELLAATRVASGESATQDESDGGRSWDEFRRRR